MTEVWIKSSIMTMGFPTSYKLSVYITPKSPKGSSKSNFVDFKKAFDSVHWGTLWKIVKLYNK